MLSKRIIPCLDVRDGKLTKGIKFKGNVDIGDPVEMARFYYEEGADEIVFYDITASSDRRDIMIDVVRHVAEEIFIPFSVGGGIRTIEDMRQVLLAGAEKVSVNTAAIQDPKIIAEGAKAFGSQCIVLGMDVKKVDVSEKIPSGYEMVIHGGRTYVGIDALAWAKEAENLGAGEICLNSIDADGTQQGYEMTLTPLISENVNIPVIANGDIRSRADAVKCLAASGADGVMIGRAAQGRPWFPGQVAEYLATGADVPDPSLAERQRIACMHFADMLSYYGLETGIRNARKHMGWYAAGLPDANAFRNLVNNTLDPTVVETAIRRFFGAGDVPVAA